MKRKMITPLLIAICVLSGCGSTSGNNQPATSETVSETEASTANEEVQTENAETEEESEVDSMVSVDKGLFDVTLTISADYVGEITQEELDAACQEKGYQSATLNDDGSVTYVMTKAQHKAMVQEIAASIDEAIQALVASESFPNFTSIEHNDDFSEFTITTKSEELDLSEEFATLGFYLYGGMYKAFQGEEVQDIVVTYVNADSGKEIETAHYADTQNQ